MQTNAELCERVEMAAKAFDKYGDAIRAVIRLNVRNESQTDDVYQNFFLAIVHKPIPSGIQNVKGYLCKAVTNDVIDAARKTKSYRTMIQNYAHRTAQRFIEQYPQSTAIRTEEADNIFRLIERQLCLREAQAVIHRYRYGHNVADAAERMAVKKRTYSRYLCAGLKKIRALMHEEKNTAKKAESFV